jgi:hypothetical protein
METQMLGCAALVLSVAACSTRTPIVVVAPKGERVVGFADTTLYTGTLDAGDGRCRGSYTGAIGSSVVPLQLSCIGAYPASGTAVIGNGRLVSGIARTEDGRELVIRTGDR